MSPARTQDTSSTDKNSIISNEMCEHKLEIQYQLHHLKKEIGVSLKTMYRTYMLRTMQC